MNRPPHVVHQDRVETKQQGHGETFQFLRRQLGAASGARKIGCSLIDLPPGKRSWPFHFHRANEEAIYVLEGEGFLRLPAGEVPVRAGHYIAFPAGEEHPHQMINRSVAPLRYLVLSTMIAPEITQYPDTGKVGLLAGAAPGVQSGMRRFGYLDEVDYWDGEEK